MTGIMMPSSPFSKIRMQENGGTFWGQLQRILPRRQCGFSLVFQELHGHLGKTSGFAENEAEAAFHSKPFFFAMSCL